MEALDKLGAEYIQCKFGTPYEEYIRRAGQEPMVFYGSMQFAKLIQDTPGHAIKVYYTIPNYECIHYYPHFDKLLLNSDYTICLFSSLSSISCNKSLFVRPSSGHKTFTGMVITREEWDGKIRELSRKINPDEIMIVAEPKEISQEWRTVVINGRVVAGGQYKETGKIVRFPLVPESVMKYAQDTVIAVGYQPDPAWTLDICNINDELYVLEIGSFSCAGLYACDCEAIVNAIETI